jgi:hypothetical protein
MKLYLIIFLFPLLLSAQERIVDINRDFNRKLNNWEHYQLRINDCRIVAISFGVLSVITHDIESKIYNKKYPLTYFSISMSSVFLIKSLHLKRKQKKILKY